MKHTNKIALITGGSRGLGRNTALKLAHDGADVILTYRERKDEGQAVLAEIEKLGRKAALLQFDVANAAGFDAFAKTVAETLQAKWQRKISISSLTMRALMSIRPSVKLPRTLSTVCSTCIFGAFISLPRGCCRSSPTAVGSSAPRLG